MRYPYYVYILFLFLASAVSAQTNHVPNCSFEIYTTCPGAPNQVPNSTGWVGHNSADYFNTCGSGGASVPANFVGNQAAAHGNAYAGYLQYYNGDFREYLSRSITPLQPGTRYEVSVSVSLADVCLFGADGTSIYFYKNAVPLVTSTAMTSIVPQISFTDTVVDQTNWVRLKQTFVADSAYNNILIGNFKNNLSTNTKTALGTTSYAYAYYYIDSIVISATNSILLTSNDTLLCPGDTIYVSYTVTNVVPFNTGNTFSLQLSDASGSFASPTVIGSISSNASGTITGIIPRTMPGGSSYRLRIASSSPADTSTRSNKNITIKPFPAITAASNSPICENSTLSITAATTSTGVISYSWKGPWGYVSSQQNPIRPSATTSMSGDYIVTATMDGCTSYGTVTAAVSIMPDIPTAANNGPVCAGKPVSLTAASTTPGVTYIWTGPASYTSTVQNPTRNNTNTSMTGTYSVVASLSGCTSAMATTQVSIIPIPVAQAGANLPVCVGGTMQLIGNSMSGASYQWSGPLSYSSTLQSPSFTATNTTQSGNYILTITANGCISEPDTVNVKVNLLSRIGGYASPNDTICAGTIPTFVAFVQDGGPAPVAQWHRNHIPVGTPNVLAYTPPTINNGDIYYCKLTAPDVCFTTLIRYTDTIRMVVLPVTTTPIVEITADPGLNVSPADLVKFTAKVTNGGTKPTYQWYKNGIKQTGATYATWSTNGLSHMDMIHVDIVSDDPCTQEKAASDTVWMQFPLGIKESRNTGLKLYPNPNNGSFTITGLTATNATIEIINSIGQVVYLEKTGVINGSKVVSTQLSTGIYQLRTGQKTIRFTVY